MNEALKYIRYDLAKDTDALELLTHLYMNGYEYGFDSQAYSLFVWEDNAYEVETIMNDRKIKYKRKDA